MFFPPLMTSTSARVRIGFPTGESDAHIAGVCSKAMRGREAGRERDNEDVENLLRHPAGSPIATGEARENGAQAVRHQIRFHLDNSGRWN